MSATRASVRQHRMAGDEHEPEEVVADVLVERGLEVGPAARVGVDGVGGDLLVLALEHLLAGGAGRWRGSSRSP